MKVFARSGYRGAGLAAVAEAAGVPISSISHHFGTKANLLKAVIAEMDSEAIRAVVHDQRPGLPAALARVLDNARYMSRRPALARLHSLLTAEALDPETEPHQHFAERNRYLRQAFADAIRYSVAAGEIVDSVDPDLKSAEIVAFMEGAALQWQLDSSRTDIVALYESYIAGVLAQLTVTGPSQLHDRDRGPRKR